MSTESPASASAGLTHAGGLTEQSGGARPRVWQVWARLSGNWACCFAAPDRDAALQFARSQIRHGTRVEVRALSDTGVEVICAKRLMKHPATAPLPQRGCGARGRGRWVRDPAQPNRLHR